MLVLKLQSKLPQNQKQTYLKGESILVSPTLKLSMYRIVVEPMIMQMFVSLLAPIRANYVTIVLIESITTR